MRIINFEEKRNLLKKEMKKLVFMFVAVAAISFASCGNKTAQGTNVDTDSVPTPKVVEPTAEDSAAALAAITAEIDTTGMSADSLAMKVAQKLDSILAAKNAPAE